MSSHPGRGGLGRARPYIAAAAVLGALLAGGSSRAEASAQIAPPDRIAAAGRIVYCAALSAPPLGYLDENAKPAGLNVDLGDDVAKRMGVAAEWRIVPFKGIIPALLAQQCDAILSQLFDKPERREVIGFVDYMYSSEALLVKAGNPRNVRGLDDLSGVKVAVNTGTTIQGLIQAQNQRFASAGKAPAELVVFPKDTDALQQLEIGQTEVYGTTLETAAYYMMRAPNRFEVAGPPFDRVPTGIGFRKNDAPFGAALQRALDAARADGTYRRIFAKWGLEGDMLP
ncbi:MAG TPA: ABC transporter substrate-binding protein [Alphaproteobacteria bacterium]|nr:ABC transporter substrate-binding protein [Alphaproteobacteria bacterium]